MGMVCAEEVGGRAVGLQVVDVHVVVGGADALVGAVGIVGWGVVGPGLGRVAVESAEAKGSGWAVVGIESGKYRFAVGLAVGLAIVRIVGVAVFESWYNEFAVVVIVIAGSSLVVKLVVRIVQPNTNRSAAAMSVAIAIATMSITDTVVTVSITDAIVTVSIAGIAIAIATVSITDTVVTVCIAVIAIIVIRVCVSARAKAGCAARRGT